MDINPEAVAKLLAGEGPIEATVVTDKWNQLYKVRVEVKNYEIAMYVDILPCEREYTVWGVFLHVQGVLLTALTSEIVRTKAPANARNVIALPMVLS